MAIFSFFTVFKGQFLEFKLFRIFQGCFTVQLSMFFVVVSLVRRNFYKISHLFLFVNNFFKFFYFFFSVVSLGIVLAGHPPKFLPVVRDSFVRISPKFEFVKHFF